MEAGESFIFQSGIVWVLLILLVILIGIYSLAFYWRRKIPQFLKYILPTYNYIQRESKKIISATRSYSSSDPLPYGPLIAGINRELDHIANQLVDLKSQYVDVQSRRHSLRFRPWQMLIGAPFFLWTWYNLANDSSRISAEITELKNLTNSIWEKVDELEKQAWQVALSVREMVGREQVIRQLVDNLGSQKLYGDTFELVAVQEDRVIEAIERIPEYFLLANELTVSQQATKKDVCDVYEIVAEVTPILDVLSNDLSVWTDEYDRLASKAADTHKQLDRVEQILVSTPDFMVLNDQIDQIRVLGDAMEVLNATLSRLEVESFVPFEEELNHVEQLTGEIGTGVRKGLRQYTSLKSALEELHLTQKECSQLFGDLVKSPQFPVLWDQSQNEFLDVNKSIADLDSIQKPRTLEAIDKDLPLAGELIVRQNRLRDHFQETTRQHRELIELMNSEEIRNGTERLHEFEQLGNQILIYHSENWPKADSVATFIEDMKHLEVRHHLITQRDPAQRISESELIDSLEKAQQLVQDQKKFQLRAEKIQVRLQWIQETEKNAKEHYQEIRYSFNQIGWLVNSNLELKKIAGTQREQYGKDLDEIGNYLNQPQSSTVEKKSRALLAKIEEIEVAVARWLERLNQDIERRRTILADKLEKLQHYANLEDPAIDKVLRLLSMEERHALQDNSAYTFDMNMDSLIDELKGRSGVWQEFLAVQQELEEIVEKPLQDAVGYADEQRTRAMDAILKAERKIPLRRAWPPCTVSVVKERQDLDEIELKWKSLKNHKTRAIWAVRQYGEVAASYQVLAEKIERTTEYAVQEQTRILDLESEIENLLGMWQRIEQSHLDNQSVVEQVRRLRAEVALRMEQVRQSWEKDVSTISDSQSYNDILQHLIDITRELKSAVIRQQTDSGELSEIRLENAPQNTAIRRPRNIRQRRSETE